MRKRGDWAKIGMGAPIGLCAGAGVALGALLGNPVLWLCIGAAVGAVLGAIIASYR